MSRLRCPVERLTKTGRSLSRAHIGLKLLYLSLLLIDIKIKPCDLLSLLLHLVLQFLQDVTLLCLLLGKDDIFLVHLLLILLLALLMDVEIKLEDLCLLFKCLLLCVHRVAKPDLHTEICS